VAPRGGAEFAGPKAIVQRLEALEAAISIMLQAHLITVVQALSEVMAEQRKAAAGQACLLCGREARKEPLLPVTAREGRGEL
jgi:hypothetical protein